MILDSFLKGSHITAQVAAQHPHHLAENEAAGKHSGDQKVCDLCSLKEDMQDVRATQRHMNPDRPTEPTVTLMWTHLDKCC